nr:AraC family transcriptional regulator [Lederbergia wuyishanensis]
MVANRTKVPVSWGETNFTPEFNKFYYIQSGTGFVKVGEQIYYPRSGELYLLPAGLEQSYGILTDDTFDKFWCHFLAKVGDTHLFDLVNAPLFIKVEESTKLQKQFGQLIKHLEKNSLSSLFYVQSIILEMIAFMLEGHDQVKSQPFSNPSFENIEEANQYAERQLSENISIEDLATVAGFHPNYFIQLFKQFTGTSPIRFLNQRRMEKARNLLTTTNQTISAIADSVGMEVSYFSRMFREQFGFTPSQYRDMMTKRNRHI